MMPNENGLNERRAWSAEFLGRGGVRRRPGRGLAAAPAADERQRFSVFFPGHMERATAVAGEFSVLAQEDPTLASVQARAEELDSTEPDGLVRHALMMFATHDRRGRALGIPSLEARQPDRVQPSRPGQQLEAATDREAVLDWWREDPKANEHHEHWHVVYPFTGIVREPGGEPTLNDRHGELFFYMHRQMLARYDAERIAVRRPAETVADARVKPLSDYRAELPGGYNPGFPLNELFGGRPAGRQLRDVQFPTEPGQPPFIYRVQFHELFRDRLLEAASKGEFRDGTPVTADLLGATAEASIASVDPQFYLSLHNLGHGLISRIVDGPFGVMDSTDVAIRDPIFYRWHRHVDDIWFEWQKKQSAQDFDHAAPVIAHEPILAFEDVVPDQANADQWANDTFGGDQWDSDISAAPATAELNTAMFTRIIPTSDGDGLVIAYLDQRPFAYVLRVENTMDTIAPVTARIFLAPEEDVENPRAWIEMDKFRADLDPGRNVIFRSGSLASVIKKPAMKPPEVVHEPSPTDPEENYCSCGWPYNLLLPRGTRDGMAFRLMVLYTDANHDEVIQEAACGSVSFCGVFNDLYPDKRPMGYPFDRPFSQPIVTALDALSHAASRLLSIKWIDPWGPHAGSPFRQ
jgi:tyrosinase